MNQIKEFVDLHSIPPKSDWAKHNKKSFSFVKPPKITQADINNFALDLDVVVEDKIQEILARQKIVEKEEKMRVKYLANNEISEINKMIFNDLSKQWYSEFFVLDEWLTYWMDIWYKIHKDHARYASHGKQEIDYQEKVRRAKEFPIQDLYKGELRESGGRFSGKCPFHEERTPSFFIFPNNTWWCFGCNEGGDSITFYMKFNNCTFMEAIERMYL